MSLNSKSNLQFVNQRKKPSSLKTNFTRFSVTYRYRSTSNKIVLNKLEKTERKDEHKFPALSPLADSDSKVPVSLTEGNSNCRNHRKKGGKRQIQNRNEKKKRDKN